LHGSSVGREHAQWVRREGSTPQSRRQGPTRSRSWPRATRCHGGAVGRREVADPRRLTAPSPACRAATAPSGTRKSDGACTTTRGKPGLVHDLSRSF
jgi:hypothetical protein